MPNWTENHITTSNHEIFSKFINANDNFDFNLFDPLPEILDLPVGDYENQAIIYYVTDKLTNPYEDTKYAELLSDILNVEHAKRVEKELKETIVEKTVYEKHELYGCGVQYIYNREHFGHTEWYGWCREHWGTKGNACNTDYDKENPTEISFDTAWTPPVPIFEKLCAMFPKDKIEFHCEYEEGLVTEYINDGGKLKLTNSYEVDFDEDEWDDE